MVIFTTAIGYLMGSDGQGSVWGLFCTVIGTAFAAASAAALNQVMEIEVDRLMERTRERPLAAGRMRRRAGAFWGIVLGALGVGGLWMLSGKLAAVLALLTIVIYLLAYTPLKRRSSWCTLVGAVSGALPPVIGWAGAPVQELWVACALFGVLFLWQIPHFLAIAWMYREEYESAGFVMLRRGDETGVWTALEGLLFSLGLLGGSLWLTWSGKVGSAFGVGSGILNLLFVGSCVVFLLDRTRVAAKRLFFASIVYLPGMLVLLVLSKR
jgi:protoheme IX farnesyltransferase